MLVWNYKYKKCRMSIEFPSIPDSRPEKSQEELYNELEAALLVGDSSELSLSEQEYRALIVWQKAAEAEADKTNTSEANIEVIVRRIELFLKTGRFTFAEYDLGDALLATENDLSLSPEIRERITALQKQVEGQE